ncbi:hypothetical protein ACOME3_004546 [Neoechinorhynchus agilis]
METTPVVQQCSICGKNHAGIEANIIDDDALKNNVKIAEPIAKSTRFTYRLGRYIGKGTFGRVFRSIQVESGKCVALKVLHYGQSYTADGDEEIAILRKLELQKASNQFNIVKVFDAFRHNGHTMIAFELLGVDLYKHLKESGILRLSLRSIRPIAQQCLVALKKLNQLGIVHADIKMDNIMLVNPIRQPYRVKLIDFGVAFTKNQKNIDFHCVQNLYYRAPEVLIGYPFFEAIDVWSLGLVLVRLFLGTHIYAASSELEQLNNITAMQGELPRQLLSRGTRTELFYDKTGTNSRSYQYRLKNVRIDKKSEDFATQRKQFSELRSLDELQKSHLSNDESMEEVEVIDRGSFVDFIKKLLEKNPHLRLKPRRGMKHEFVTMEHLSVYSEYHEENKIDMRVCDNIDQSQEYQGAQMNTSWIFKKTKFHFKEDSDTPIKRERVEETCSKVKKHSSPKRRKPN